MKLESANRTAIGLIGVGIGFVLLPVLLDVFTSSPFAQLLNTVSVGIVYICIGLAIGGWQQRTHSNEIPFWVIGSMGGVAILTLIGLELLVLRLSAVFVHKSSHGVLGIVEQIVMSPHLLLGWTVALLIVADSASTQRQWRLAAAGIAAVPPVVTVVSIQFTYAYVAADPRGYSATGAAAMVGQFVFPYSLVVLLLAGLYTLPYYACESKI